MKRTHIIFATFVFVLAGCSSKQLTFNDIESGEVALEKNEIAAIENLISTYQIPKNELLITVDKAAYPYSLHIENDHVTKLYFNGRIFRDMKFVSHFKKLTSITISNAEINQIEGIDELNSLTQLELIHNEIATLNLGTVNNSIEHLNLHNNKLKNIKGIKNFKKLAYLTVSKNQISEIEEINNNSALKFLSLDHNLMDSLKISNCPKLHDINCTNNQLTYFQFNNLTAMSKADLQNNKISNFNLHNTTLYELNLNGNNFKNIPNNFNPESVVHLVYEKPEEQDVPKRKSTGDKFWDEMYATLDSVELTKGVVYTNERLHLWGSSSSGRHVTIATKGKRGSFESLKGSFRLTFTKGVIKGNGVCAEFTVDSGEIRVYLEVLDDRGRMKYQTAKNGQPGQICGNAFFDVEMHDYYVWIESVNGTAKGIKYNIKY